MHLSLKIKVLFVMKKKNCVIEKGCRILFNRISKDELKNVWKDIKINHELNCAHVLVPTIFSGCILDFLRPSQCPGSKK